MKFFLARLHYRMKAVLNVFTGRFRNFKHVLAASSALPARISFVFVHMCALFKNRSLCHLSLGINRSFLGLALGVSSEVLGEAQLSAHRTSKSLTARL